MRSSDKVNLIGKVRELLEENLKLRSRIMELEKQALAREWAEEPTARETTGKILRPRVMVLAIDEDSMAIRLGNVLLAMQHLAKRLQLPSSQLCMLTEVLLDMVYHFQGYQEGWLSSPNFQMPDARELGRLGRELQEMVETLVCLDLVPVPKVDEDPDIPDPEPVV